MTAPNPIAATSQKSRILKALRFTLFMLLSAIVGATATYFYLSYKQEPKPKQNIFDWIQLAKASKTGVIFSSDALFKGDISFPNIKDIQGQAKFLPDDGTKSEVQLGYVVTVTVDSLDTSKIPKKYLREKPEIFEGVRVTRPTIEQVNFEGNFNFKLKDKDGFVMLEISTPPLLIESGKENSYQASIDKLIPIDTARRTKQIDVSFHLDKCLTCEGN